MGVLNGLTPRQISLLPGFWKQFLRPTCFVSKQKGLQKSPFWCWLSSIQFQTCWILGLLFFKSIVPTRIVLLVCRLYQQAHHSWNHETSSLKPRGFILTSGVGEAEPGHTAQGIRFGSRSGPPWIVQQILVNIFVNIFVNAYFSYYRSIKSIHKESAVIDGPSSIHKSALTRNKRREANVRWLDFTRGRRKKFPMGVEKCGKPIAPN